MSIRADRAILRLVRQCAVERKHDGIGVVQQGFGAPNLTSSWEKDQNVSGIIAQRGSNHRDDGRLRSRARAWRHVSRLDGKGASFAREDRRIAEERRDGVAVERRRHDQDAQVGAYERLRAEREREPQVRVETALVELVEDDEANAVQRRITLQAPREDALGHHLDARVRSDACIAAHPVAHGRADALAAQLGDAIRRGASGEPPRFQHDDRLPSEPGRRLERCRNERGLAGARGRLQDHGVIRLERAANAGEERLDGEERSRKRSATPSR